METIRDEPSLGGQPDAEDSASPCQAGGDGGIRRLCELWRTKAQTILRGAEWRRGESRMRSTSGELLRPGSCVGNDVGRNKQVQEPTGTAG